MSKPMFLLAATALGALVATPAAAHSVTPEKILRAQDDLTYTGLLLINGSQRVQVTHGGAQQHRQAFFNPEGQVADLMVSDGRNRWHYAPKSQVVRLMPLEELGEVAPRLALLNQNYRFQVMGQARKADRLVVITRFTPLNAGNLTHMLWVDPHTNLPLAVERRQQDGKLVDRSEYLRIQYRPKLSQQAFQFRIPDGCRVQSSLTMLAHGSAGAVIPQDLSFKPPAPRATPKGYRLSAWKYFTSQRNVPTFNWRYHDGLNTLSLFAVHERFAPKPPQDAHVVSIEGGQGHMTTQGANHMLMWRANQVTYTLIGHLPEQQMIEMAASTLTH